MRTLTTRLAVIAAVCMVSGACAGPADLAGPELTLKRRNDALYCVGTTSGGQIVVEPADSNGYCAPGFDLRQWG